MRKHAGGTAEKARIRSGQTLELERADSTGMSTAESGRCPAGSRRNTAILWS